MQQVTQYKPEVGENDREPRDPDLSIADDQWHDETDIRNEETTAVKNELPADYIPYSIEVIYPSDEFDPDRAKEDMMKLLS